ncbi:unnamed protein product, partial [Ectocarpus sp. 12 AP-2014]
MLSADRRNDRRELVPGVELRPDGAPALDLKDFPPGLVLSLGMRKHIHQPVRELSSVLVVPPGAPHIPTGGQGRRQGIDRIVRLLVVLFAPSRINPTGRFTSSQYP